MSLTGHAQTSYYLYHLYLTLTGFQSLKCNLTFLPEFYAFATVTVISRLLILIVNLNSWNLMLLLIGEPGFEFIGNCHVLKIDGPGRFMSWLTLTKDSFVSSVSFWRIVINLTSVVESSVFSFWLSKLNVWPKDSIMMLTNLLPTVSDNFVIFLIKN